MPWTATGFAGGEEILESQRLASHGSEGQARRAETKRQHHATKRARQLSQQPAWLDEKTYREKIQPRLAEVTIPDISTALGISEPYAANIRTGKVRPHRRH
jgi:hypothetical protein